MPLPLPPGYSLSSAIPSVVDYQRLRAVSGLSPFAERAARLGLPNSIECVLVRAAGEVVGMGRIVGDGGLFFQLVDIAVQPNHQGKGLGKAIVDALLQALARRLDAPAYVSLIADGPASDLYARFGFEPVAPKSQGMARWLHPSSPPSS